MKIKSLRLKNFKRFTDLTLQDIPENTKLVLLIGANGSGKSSVFDAFAFVAIDRKSNRNPLENPYYHKNKETNIEVVFETIEYEIIKSIDGWENLYKLNQGSFYGRTSFRQVPRLAKTSLGTYFNILSDNDRPPTFIDRDERFENDLEHLVNEMLTEFFRTANDKSEIKEKVINRINNALERLFGHQNGTRLKLIELIPPLEGKAYEINFQKGESIFHYNYLSAGEKEIFNILINLVARGEYYTDTIFFFDEIDLHLNTKLQYNFLKEIIENWIPDNCQFWTASHSLGFIQYAKEKEQAVIFDFDDYDFDLPKVLSPEPKDNADIYDIAVSKEMLPELFKDRRIVFVENEDRKYYASLNIENTLFVPENNRNSVFHKVKSGEHNGLVDRDFLTNDDIHIIQQQYPRLKILQLYCIENYLFHPDNLQEYYETTNKPFNKEEYIQKLYNEKEIVKSSLSVQIATARQGYPYFKDPGLEASSFKKRFTPDKENFEQTLIIVSYLSSKDANEFLKSFSLKDYGKSLPERQHINPFELSKTKWFSQQIASILNNQHETT